MSASDRYDSQALLAHLGWLRALSRRLVTDQHLAEDLAQDACVIALEGAPRDPARMRSWLDGVLHHLVQRRVTTDAGRRERETRHAARERLEATDALVEQVEAQGALVRLVLDLDEAYREVVLLRYFEDLPVERIAARLGLPERTVRHRLARAHARLRERLERSLGKDPQVWSLALLGVPLAGKATKLTTSGSLLTSQLGIAAAFLVVAATAVTVAVLAGGDGGVPGLRSPQPDVAGPRVPVTAGLAPGPATPPQDAREEIAAAPPAAPVEEAAAPAAPVRDPARELDHLRVAIEATLSGEVDVEAFVRMAMRVLEQAPDSELPPSQASADKALAYQLPPVQEGVTAWLQSNRTVNPSLSDPALSVRLRLEPPDGGPYLVEGSVRQPPELELAADTDRQGRLLGLRIAVDIPPSIAGNRDSGISLAQGRTPLGLFFALDLDDPGASRAHATWIEGGVEHGGDLTDWRFVGGPLPSREDLQGLATRLHELHVDLRR